MIYDALLVLALVMSTIFVIVAFTNASVPGGQVLVLSFLEAFAFFCYFWMFRGQTLGMLAWRLTVRSNDGYRLTFTQAMLRFSAAAISIACAGLGYLWILFDPAQRSWPDMFSDSIILYTPKQDAKSGA